MKNEKLKKTVQFDEQGNILAVRPFCQVLHDHILQIYYSINKHRTFPVVLSTVLMLCSYLQIFSQLLDKSFLSRSDKTWGPFQAVATIIDLTRISPLIMENPNGTVWVFIYFTFACLVLYIASIYFMHHSIMIRKLYFNMPIEACSIFSAILLWLLIGPICEIYAGIYYCTGDEINMTTHASKQYAFLMNNTECWSGLHILMASIVTLCLILYIVLTFSVAVFLNNSNPSFLSSNEDGMTRLDTNNEVYYAIFRIITSLLFKWLIDHEFTWVFLLCHLVYAIVFAYRYCRNIPYYNAFISQLYCACIISHLWISGNIFTVNILGDEKGDSLYKGVAIVTIIGTIVAFIFAKHLRARILEHKIISLHHARINSEEELDVYIQSIERLFESQQSNIEDEILLRGVVWRHKAECIDVECPLLRKDNNKIFYPLVEEDVATEPDNVKEKIVVLSLLNSILKERGKRVGDQGSACFHIIYANFLFHEYGNAHMAIVEVMKAIKSSPTIQQKMSIYALLRSIEDYLVKKYRKQKGGKGDIQNTTNLQGAADFWDVTIVIKFENLLLQFIKYIEQCAGDHIEFWSQLESMVPDLNEVSKTGLKILETSKDIQRIWNKLNKINPNHPKALNIYGYYLREISNDSEQGQEFIEKAITINVHKSVADDPINDFELMFAEDTAIIMMNGSAEQLGKIVKTNSGVMKLFGYNQFEIYGNDVSIIMPGIFAKQHTKFMQRYFETGKQYVISNERVLYALHRNGYLFCISIVVKPVPSLTVALPQYIALIRQINKDYDYIITDSEGKIDSISIGIYHMYNINCSFIKENHIYIQLICPELADPVSFIDEKIQLRFCNIQGRKRLTFSIPRDFTALAHLFSQTAKDPIEFAGLSTNNQQITDSKLPYNYSEAPYFFNLLYKIYKAKFPTSSFDISVKNILKTCFDYTKCDMKTQAVCEVSDLYYSGDTLRLKVFKVYRPKVIKKSSIDEYQPQDKPGNTPRSNKNQKVKAPSNHSDEGEGAVFSVKRSHTGGKDKNNVLSIISSDEKIDDKHIVQPRIDNMESNDWVSSNQNTSVIKKPHEMSKKVTGMDITDSGVFTLHISNTDNSLSIPITNQKDTPGNETSLMTEKLQKQRSVVIKTIDIRQEEVARKVLFHQNTLRSQIKEDSEEAPSKQPSKKEFENEENKESPGEATPENNLISPEKPPKSPNKIQGSEEPQLQKGFSMKRTKKDMEEIGSVASSTGNVMRFIRSLRAALHEDIDPPAIVQLKRLACIVFLSLIILAILCYFLSQDIFTKLRKGSDFIVKVKERSTSILGIGKSVRFLVLMNGDKGVKLNQNIYDYNEYTGNGIKYVFNNQSYNFSYWTPTVLEQYVETLKNSEDFVADTLRGGTSDISQKINPDKIDIQNTFGITTLSSEDAINGLISHALKLKMIWKPEKSSWDQDSDDSINYVIYNAYNSILGKLSNSLNAILENTDHDIGNNNTKFMIFFCVASGALLISISIVLPVVVKARKNKQELLGLFFEIPPRRISMQLEKCNQFCRMIHGENEVERPEMEDEDNINARGGKQEQKNVDEADALLENNVSNSAELSSKETGGRAPAGKKKKAIASYSTNIVALIFESFITLGILLSFFLYQYVRSHYFTDIVNHLMEELGETARRMYSNELYFSVCLELIATNGTSQVMNSVTENYIDTYGINIMREQESFLQSHSDNNEYNTKSYKKIFDSMIYSDICLLIFSKTESEQIIECQKYMSGILQKGLSSANVAFWDSLRDVAKDFKRTYPRSINLQTSMINDKRVRENHWLLFEYFSRAYNLLQEEMQTSLEGIFEYEEFLMMALFISYLCVLLIIYIIFVKLFIENTRNSLWVTKSMLTILPAEIILQVAKIKRFLVSATKSVIYGIHTD